MNNVVKNIVALFPIICMVMSLQASYSPSEKDKIKILVTELDQSRAETKSSYIDITKLLREEGGKFFNSETLKKFIAHATGVRPDRVIVRVKDMKTSGVIGIRPYIIFGEQKIKPSDIQTGLIEIQVQK